jgi:O-antigen ligase
MYWSLILGVYYYWLCRHIQDYEPVKKAVQAIFFFIVFMIIMQLLGLDTLCNFNQKETIILGTIGNTMILGSFVCVLAPFLLGTPLNWVLLILVALVSGSSGTILSIMCGLAVLLWHKCRKLRLYIVAVAVCVPLFVAWKTHDLSQATLEAGRFPVWKRTIEVSKIQGHGIATYRILFPLLSQDLKASKGANMEEWTYDNTKGKGLAWRRAHNLICQLLFEYGYIGLFLFFGWFCSVAYRARHNILKVVGLTIIGVNTLTAFPDRMTQAVLILLMFMAYCERVD